LCCDPWPFFKDQNKPTNNPLRACPVAPEDGTGDLRALCVLAVHNFIMQEGRPLYVLYLSIINPISPVRAWVCSDPESFFQDQNKPTNNPLRACPVAPEDGTGDLRAFAVHNFIM